MKITVTGAASGIGRELVQQLGSQHTVTALTRFDVDLSNIAAVADFALPESDMLINCAATDAGGKIDFVNHNISDIIDIFNVNLLAPMLLSQKALGMNTQCRVVNITSTNNNRYYANDLAYSLTKQALSNFGDMLRVDYPGISLLEIRLGLTKTNFNHNRYRTAADRFQDIYQHPHLTAASAVHAMIPALFDTNIKFIEISP